MSTEAATPENADETGLAQALRNERRHHSWTTKQLKRANQKNSEMEEAVKAATLRISNHEKAYSELEKDKLSLEAEVWELRAKLNGQHIKRIKQRLEKYEPAGAQGENNE